ncbi:DUF4240 domain-containing protein [Streptomyces sp. NPDC012389]|uniref:DUF4240 domain-containing protein n=1 Tax=Streptomyces sp. NPDC012389 TaxID=3364830 RepID=UPI0036EE58EB
MTEEKFWSFVSLLGGAASEVTTRALVDALTREGGSQIQEFAEILTEKMHLLRGSSLQGIRVRDISDPAGALPVPLLGDALVNFELAIIAAGKSTFHEMLNSSAQATGRAWDFSEADSLPEAVSVAYEQSTGKSWVGPLPGMDVSGTGQPKSREDDETPWIMFVLHSEDSIPAAYFDASGDVVEMIHKASQWKSWWSNAEQHSLTIEIEYVSQPESHGVTTRKGEAWASFRNSGSRFRGLNKGGLAHLAVTDLESALAFVSTALNLPVPPEVPRLARAVPPTRDNDGARARLEELRRRHRK